MPNRCLRCISTLSTTCLLLPPLATTPSPLLPPHSLLATCKPPLPQLLRQIPRSTPRSTRRLSPRCNRGTDLSLASPHLTTHPSAPLPPCQGTTLTRPNTEEANTLSPLPPPPSPPLIIHRHTHR